MNQVLPAAQASGPGGMPVPQTSAAARGLRLCFVLQEYARPGILRPGYAQRIDPHRPGKGADVSPSRRQTGQKATLQPRIPPRLFACQAGAPSYPCKCVFALRGNPALCQKLAASLRRAGTM